MNVNLKAHKILIIEDYATMRTSIKEMLYLGYAQHIIEAHNAKAALLAMEKQKFDIVLCDYNLGAGKNGQQILEEAKYRRLLPYTATFIMVTAEQGVSMVLSAMDNKPDEYLAKPFNAQQLLGRIEKQMQRKAYFASIDEAVDKDDLPLAITQCDKLLNQQDPKMRLQLLKVGAELAINVGDFKTAEAYYQEVLIQRDLTWAKHGLGVIACLQSKFVAAIDLFKEVIEKAPMMIETYDWLTKAYEALERREEAYATVLRAVELSPQSVLRQRKLAVLAEKLDNDEAALKAYKSAIKLSEHSVHKSSQDLAGLAKLYAKTNNAVEAVKLIREMHESFPNSLEAELWAAKLETEINFKQNNMPLAEQAYAKLKPITQQRADISKELLLDIAEVHFFMGNIQASNQLIGYLIGNYVDDENYISELIRRHVAFSKDGFYAEALATNTKLALIDVNNRGVNLFKQGHVSAALESLEIAYNKTPNNKFILLNLAKILLRDMKSSGVTKEKHLRINNYIAKATALGVSQDKTGHIKMELAKLICNKTDSI